MDTTNNLRKLRERANLSREGMAYKAHISCNYVWGLETGKHKPSLEVARRVTDALNAAIDGGVEIDDVWPPTVEAA